MKYQGKKFHSYKWKYTSRARNSKLKYLDKKQTAKPILTTF